MTSTRTSRRTVAHHHTKEPLKRVIGISVGSGIVERMPPDVTVRTAVASDGVETWIRRSWGEPVMAVHGDFYDVLELATLVAIRSDDLVGVLTYTFDGNDLEIVSCDARPSGTGVGRALVAATVDAARGHGARRVWCTTTNDNLPALGFWQAVGFTLSTLRTNAVASARRQKPSIPLSGYRGLPIRDELDLEYFLVKPVEGR